MDPITLAGGLGLGAIATALVLFFSFDRKFKGYIREAAGQRPEVTTVITPQPLVVTSQPTFADKKQTEERFQHVESKIENARLENKAEMQKLRDEATEGRHGLHADIKGLGREINDKLHQFSVDITGAVGELRGEVKQISKKP